MRPSLVATRPRLRLVGAISLLVLLLAACGGGEADSRVGSADQGGRSASAVSPSRPLTISAIPDQDPDKLQRLYGKVAEQLSKALGVPVNYMPVTDYAASVSLFRTGDLDMVWFGGLTGVQARLRVPGANAIVQRDIDEAFHSVFIVNTSTGIAPFTDVRGLAALKGKRFTFGSESSTSGRLMPQYFLGQAGVKADDFAGQPGYSGSHDKTIELVTAGSFEAGALNEQVWKSRVEAGQVDTSKVAAVYRTPAYHDYHWVIRPDVANRYPGDFEAQLKRAFLSLDASDPAQKEVLDLFGATGFIETNNSNYREIEDVARQLGLVR